MALSEKPGVVGFIVAADEPALFFRSTGQAEGYLEAIDVDNGVYTAAYDRDGRRYTLASRDGLVVISPDLTQQSDPEGLKALLHFFLTGIDVPTGENATLGELLALCEPYVLS